MDQSSQLTRILTKIGIAILVIALFDLVYLNYVTFKNQSANQVATTVEINPTPAALASPAPSDSTTATLASPTPQAATPTTSVTQQTIVQTAQKEIFIPVGDGSTTSGSYSNLPGAQVTIDSSKYSGVASVNFEASIWVTNGNGKAYAQLYNVTGGHMVWNSEISTSSGSGVLMSSPITLDSGANTYQIQAKTDITQFAANVSTGRIKIVLR